MASSSLRHSRPPRTTLGIIGGGQLAQMTHQAAISLDIDVVVLCPDDDSPAIRGGARHCSGAPDQLDDLLRLADQCDVVTLDHEQTPAAMLHELAARGHRVAPGARAARLGQDKAEARAVLGAAGIAMAPWACTKDLGAVVAFGERHRWPLYLKRPRGGYDGRGVWRADDQADVESILEETDGDLLVEPAIAFLHELSVVVVRSWRGETVAYPPVETIQRDGRCHEVFAPAGVPRRRCTQARHLAVAIADAVGLVGAMAVELFVTEDELLLNELAVRPHNSGHLTIEACATSQFENHVRAVLDLPLGATELIVPGAAMVNLVGGIDGTDPFSRLHHALAVSGARIHRYGKVARPGRKVGHVTATGPSVEAARATATRAAGAMAAVCAA